MFVPSSFSPRIERYDFQRNLLLSALPSQTCERWLASLEPVQLPLGRVVIQPCKQITHVYVPTTAVVSLLHVLEDDATSEMALIGNEGVVGLDGFAAGCMTPYQSVVQVGGEGLRLHVAALRSELDRGEATARLLLRYLSALFAMVAQSAACWEHHSVEQRLSRWLLIILDRVPVRELPLTQERIARVLDVQRGSVKEGALRLQRDGLIGWADGRVVVPDRVALEQRACECYGLVRKEYARLLPHGGVCAAGGAREVGSAPDPTERASVR